MSITIAPNELVIKDPASQRLYQFDFDDMLAALAEIASATITITGDDAVLTHDNDAIVTGNRKVNTRVLAGTFGKRYTVTCSIVTNETPTQTEERSFRLLVEQE